jgi:asparagine synthase (glutamine-hydrolysing)
LGHSRLSVIDPENGLQPMIRQYHGQTFVIVYNGELYNTDELRQTLIHKGFHFETQSDTEVVLIAYIAFGKACTTYFNGIYAFAVWEEVTRQLFLCRDRMGVKPLFYSLHNNQLLFGSELKTILAHGSITPTLGLDELRHIFALGPARIPGKSYLKDIDELKPGECLTYSPIGFCIETYWQLKTAPHTESLDETIEHTHFLVTDAIKRQTVSDVPICTFLSGGLDSSLISATVANMSKELNTFSVDYEENDKFFSSDLFQPDPDSKWTDFISDYLGTHHQTIYINNTQLADALAEAATCSDGPGMADVDSSLLLFCRQVKKQATVALSGECADEIFGGYPWYHRPEMMNSEFFPWSGDLSLRTDVLSPHLREALQLSDYVKACKEASIHEISSELVGLDDFEVKMRELSYLNLKWFMCTLLNRKDRMSMGCGLEVRVPFCDHRIVEYMWNVPWTMKNYNNREKGLLRKISEDVLPQEIAWRKKSPYPKTHHPLYVKRITELFALEMSDPYAPIKAFVSPDIIASALTGDINTARPWFGQLMKGPQLIAWLLQFNMWLKKTKVTLAI